MKTRVYAARIKNSVELYNSSSGKMFIQLLQIFF